MTLISATPFTAAPCSACPGRASGVCGTLPEEVLARLGAAADEVELDAGDRIPIRGCCAGAVLLIREGMVRAQRHTLNGRRQILLIAGPGECLDPENTFTRDGEVETVTPSRVCRVDRAVFEAIRRQESTLRLALARQSQIWLDKTRRLTWILALPVGDRLRTALVLSCNAMPTETLDDGSVVVSMLLPRADLADLLATTPETISRLLHQFEDQGMIEILDPRRFRLRDLSRLSAGLGALLAA